MVGGYPARSCSSIDHPIQRIPTSSLFASLDCTHPRGDEGAFRILSIFSRVFSVRQNPEQQSAPSTQHPVPSIPAVPTIRVSPPPSIHPYEATRQFQLMLPQIRRNSRGQFIQCTATTALCQAIFTPEGSAEGTLSSLPPSSASSSLSSSPSSVTFSQKPYSDGTPDTSPAPQQLQPLPPSAQRIMSEHKGSLQWEGSSDDNLSPGQFLREIENKIDERGHSTDKLKINCLKNNIAYGSGADKWFGKLIGVEKDTYEHLVDSFEKQWPLTVAPKASKSERIQMLKDWVLKPAELGIKVEGPGGTQVWSHVKWATGLASRVRDAEDSTGFLLGDVYNALPKPVRDLIRKEPRASYQELTTAVLALDTSDLKDAAVNFTRDEETARLAREPASPTKVLREALTATHLQAPQYRAPPLPTQNLFQASGGQGNLFGTARGNTLPFRGGGPGALGMGGGTTRP